MHSRRLLVLTGLVGLTFATLAGINSVTTRLDGPRDPALEKLVRRQLAQRDHRAIDRTVSER